MAHKQLPDGRVVIDWETGDPEGDRKYYMAALRDFLSEINKLSRGNKQLNRQLRDLFEDWDFRLDQQVDDFPRIWIKRPE